MGGGFRGFKSKKQQAKVMIILEKRHGGGAELEEHIKRKETEHQNTNTTNIVTTKKRRTAVLEKFKSKNPIVSDDEVQHLKNSLNRKDFSNDDNRRFADEASEIVIRHPNGIRLNEDFTKKGIEFLTRANIQKQLDDDERDIVDDFKEFHWLGFVEEGNAFRSFFKPEFRVISHDGSHFDYTVGEDVTKINITA